MAPLKPSSEPHDQAIFDSDRIEPGRRRWPRDGRSSGHGWLLGDRSLARQSLFEEFRWQRTFVAALDGEDGARSVDEMREGICQDAEVRRR